MKNFNDLCEMATYLRGKLERKDYVLIFGNDSVGKTRLSTAFRDIGWQEVNCPGFSGEQSAKQMSQRIKGRDPCSGACR